jgi:hypothetical protein
LQGEVVPASAKEPEGCCAADKFTVLLETAGLNPTDSIAFYSKQGQDKRQAVAWFTILKTSLSDIYLGPAEKPRAFALQFNPSLISR